MKKLLLFLPALMFANDNLSKALNPDISLTADFLYLNKNFDGELYTKGFTHLHSEEEEHSHSHTELKDGFNLNYAELGISSTVDPFFDLEATFHLSEDDFEIEELFFRSTLPYGFGLKGGKFLSNFGRINNQHSHYWNFNHQPLIYNLLFGEHNILEKGIQLSYIPTLPHYLEFGIEALAGENEGSFGYAGFEIGDKKVEDETNPSLIVAYLKSSVDIKDISTLIGISYATGSSNFNHGDHAFSGDTKIYGADLTIKYPIDSYSTISWQSEYLYRDLSGDRYGLLEDESVKISKMDKEQSGLYSELSYKNRDFRVSARYDLVNKNVANSIKTTKNLDGYSLAFDYLPSEFSRVRFEYSEDSSKFSEVGANETLKEFMVVFNFTIGAHKAHSF